MADAGSYRGVDRLGAGQLAGLLPDPAGMRPAYRHLAQAIGELILDGRIALHVRLPAERELAAALRVSRATVTAVYDLLRESGYALSRQGSGTWTALPEGRALRGVARYMRAADTAIDLTKAAPAMPEDMLRDALAAAAPLLAEHTRTAGYHPYGLPELRAAVAERFTRRGLATVPEQILVTSGAQHALSLVLGLLGRPGDRILVENPSYPTALDAMRRARLATVPVPVTDSGWDAAITESTLRQAVPRLAYLIPDFHNPTGHVMPEQERGRVLRAARASGTWLVVDESLAEIALDVPPPRPFTAHAAPGATGQVITIGSMSKTHWGGLRVGWLRAPSKLVTELAAQRVASDMGGAVLDQLVALALLARDSLPARLETLRAQRAALVDALAEHLPHWTFRLPPGGLSLWADIGEPVASPLAERALDYGVRIEAGSWFATDPGVFEQRLRIPFTLPPAALREAAARLAAALASPDLTSASAASRPRWVA
ncbi:PLP-dependent aminotransferase family protein [Streptomyces sp. HPF1205]|uniref:MocR-like transcription factor YczR n=1 Tax=Streptomyces sp. HPF1205 TaxID=2873262 RepID=UPI001CEC5CDC|nr:PLP-dependent aminotransferase family protein [Streptomyces sp. HPF1205]